MTAYYNEIDPFAAQWLRNLIDAGHIAKGEVDERSIVDIRPSELRGFKQCHFFAGIGGWSLAARLAGWPDDRPLWTGSCPCQPFSVAGKQEGQADERHLWPAFFALINSRRPDVVMGEQVAAAVGKDWLDGVYSDLESIGYACGSTVVPACAVDAPHRRDRLWFVADASSGRRPGSCEGQGEQPRRAEVIGAGQSPLGNAIISGLEGQSRHGDDRDQSGWIEAQQVGPASEASSSAWIGSEWLVGSDGKARRVGTRVCRVVDGIPTGMVGMRPGQDAEEREMIPLLAHGVPARVGKLRAFGNAIVPQVAAEVIASFMDVRP